MSRKQVRKEGSKRRYPVTVAGQLFKHLGLQMYSGAVPAISEFTSNSYDTMARNVWVTIPTGRSIKSTDGITVKDDGHGMNYDDCRFFYLNIGRNRRSDSSGFTKKFHPLFHICVLNCTGRRANMPPALCHGSPAFRSRGVF